MDELRTVCAQAHKTAEMLKANAEWMLAIQGSHFTLKHDGPAIQVKRDMLREMVPEEDIKVLPIGYDFAYIYTVIDGVLFFSGEELGGDV